MLESRRATPRRARPLATFVRAPPGSSPPRDPSPIYLPWPGRSAICGGRRTFSPGGFFSVRTATTTPPSSHGARSRTCKTGATGPRGGLRIVPPPSIASPHHQHACASSTDAWVLLRELIDCGFMPPLRGAHIRSTCPEPGYRHAWFVVNSQLSSPQLKRVRRKVEGAAIDYYN